MKVDLRCSTLTPSIRFFDDLDQPRVIVIRHELNLGRVKNIPYIYSNVEKAEDPSRCHRLGAPSHCLQELLPFRSRHNRKALRRIESA